MQNDDTRAAKNKKSRENLKRYVAVGLLFFAELAVMYIIQNVHGCESSKTAFMGIVFLAASLAIFFPAISLCRTKSKK